MDWERMRGRIEIQFRIVADYHSHVARFAQISAYRRRHQPPALLLWGRHDIYFDISETLAYHRELERIDLHLFDGAHLLLKTHAPECAALMRAFVRNTWPG